MRTIAAAAAFRTIQVVSSPVAFVGYVLWTVRAIRFGRRTGVSVTALASAYTRWMQHQLGTRHDEPCARLMMVLPNVSLLGLRLVTGPTLLAHRLTGYVPRIYRYPYEGYPSLAHESAARTSFLDAALDRRIDEIDQLVVLGAGNDTRAYRLPAATHIRCFEVDAPKTQAVKRAMLDRAGVDARCVTFVAADFMTEDWFENLVDAGFEPDRSSFFLWEGVTMYLDRAAVERTLRAIAGTAAGSVVAFDYLAPETAEGQSLYLRVATASLDAVGEPWRSGIGSARPGREQIAAFLESCGLSLGEQRNFGKETDRKHVLGGFATAIVPGAVNRQAG